MRQVPSYLIIGNGRMARHMACYFSLLDIPFVQWSRVNPIEILQAELTHATHVLILISDGAIEPFIQTYLSTCQAHLIHFSGSLVTDLAMGAHPLMSFGPGVYTLADYQTIPFITETHKLSFNEMFPGLMNPSYQIDADRKAKYHALCVISGNFSCLLWQKIFSEFEKTFNIPSSAVHPYLQRQMQNIMTNYQHALTGPLVRNDVQTLNANLTALENDPFQQVYKAFVACYEEMKNENS